MPQLTYPAAPPMARSLPRAGLLDSFLSPEAPRPTAASRLSHNDEPTPEESLLAARKLFKSYRKSKHIIPVLRGVDFCVRPGEFVAIVGQSGSAPDIYGKNIANPIAMIWSGALMLDFLTHGQGAGRQAHDAIVAAIEEVIKSGPRTPDLGGTANTTQVGEAIAARIAQG